MLMGPRSRDRAPSQLEGRSVFVGVPVARPRHRHAHRTQCVDDVHGVALRL